MEYTCNQPTEHTFQAYLDHSKESYLTQMNEIY